MKIVAAVFADFAETFLGSPAQLLTQLGNRTILGHTLTRTARIQNVTQRCVIVQPRDEDTARSVLAGLDLQTEFTILPIDDGVRPRRPMIRCGRKWNLTGWRGSPMNTTWFDEYIEPRIVAKTIAQLECDGLLCIDGHQAALDPAIADRMVTHQCENDAEAGFVFTQAPPGLAGIILRLDIAHGIAKDGLPVGILMTYRPERPQLDQITKAICCHISPDIVQTAARFTGDTQASRTLLERAFAALGEDCNAATLCTWVRQIGDGRAETLPVEVELELTTDHPLPDSTLRPPAEQIPPRRIEDLEAISASVRQLAQLDDRLLVLGGHGDPLLHPDFPEICHRIRDAGVCGIAVVSPLYELPDAGLAALREARVDALEVTLGAHSAATHQQVHNCPPGVLEKQLANIDRVLAMRQQHSDPHPLVIPSMTRCAATLDELEPFFDQWIRKAGTALIAGHNDYCGARPRDVLQSTEPLIRQACQRLDTRMMLLANGSAVLCHQDFRGEHPIGSWHTQELAALWRGDALQQARRAHQTLDRNEFSICQKCHHWYRP